MQATMTDQQKRAVRACVAQCQAVAEAIKALGSVPSGHLYAQLMGHMTLEHYQRIIGHLTDAGVIRVDGSHLIRWVAK